MASISIADAKRVSMKRRKVPSVISRGSIFVQPVAKRRSSSAATFRGSVMPTMSRPRSSSIGTHS